MPVTPTAYAAPRHGAGALLLVISVCAAIVRLPHITRGLWLDEAWVANSVLEDSWGGVFYYERWLQTTPPLLLAVFRGIIHLLPYSDLSFRLMPLVFGVAAVILYAQWSRSALRSPADVVGAALICFAPAAIVYSQEVKQYASDLFCAVLLLLLAWRYGEQPTRLRYTGLTAAVAVSLLLSYPAVFFLPVVICAVVFAPEPVRQTRFTRGMILAAMGILIEASLYVVFVRPNTSAALHLPWSVYFRPDTDMRGQISHYAIQFRNLIEFLPIPEARRAWTESVLVALMGFGICSVLVRNSQRHRRRLVLFLGLPVAATVAANLAGIYPFANNRVNISLVPCVAGYLALGIDQVWIAQSGWLPKRIPERFVTLVAAGAMVLAAGMILLRMESRKFRAWEDARGAYAYLRSQLVSGDVVYVHASMSEQARLYRKLWRWRDAPLRFGQTGWPCCTRQAYGPDAHDPEGVKRDFTRIVNDAPPRLWVIHTTRPGHWQTLRRDEPMIVAGLLQTWGCVAEDGASFQNVAVTLYRCGR